MAFSSKASPEANTGKHPVEASPFLDHPVRACVNFIEPPSRPGEILLRRAGFAGISPGRQERQGKIFCLAGMPQGKTCHS
jgi:hypothetical protein